MRNLASLLVLSTLMASCMKKELPVPTPDKGDIVTAFSDLGPDYKKQMYFDLSSNQNVGENLKTIWDIGLSNSSESIVLNAAKVMYAAQIHGKTFNEISDTLGFSANRRWDSASGNTDSMAIMGHNLFIVDRGIDENGVAQGWFKMEILENTSSTFIGKFAKLDGSNETTIQVEKNPLYNYTHISLNGPAHEVAVQPEKNKWDLYITQYTHVYWIPEFFPYIVVGVLANPSGDVLMKEITAEKTFEEVDYDYASNLTLSNKLDQIGFDWKTFNGTIYAIQTNRTWVIRDHEGFLYKLRIIDFYNAIGLKGCPTFEYQRL